VDSPLASRTRPRQTFTVEDARRLAQELDEQGRGIVRNGPEGFKTFCPLCRSETHRPRPRRTLSVSANDGKPLVYCHKCKADGRELIRDLVSRGLLPDLSADRFEPFTAQIKEIRAAIENSAWSGRGKATELAVLELLFQIEMRCRKTEFGASIREVAQGSRISDATASRVLKRLVNGGWIKLVRPTDFIHPATWRLCVPENAGDRTATVSEHAQRAGDRLLHSDPCYRGGRAGSSRSVTPHDVFRWGAGLGPVNGRIYAALENPRSATELATLLKYKSVRNVRVHLRRLERIGLVRRRTDRRFERCDDRRLNEVAENLGVLGESDRQRARHLQERTAFRRWCDAFEHWKLTGVVVDPDTGVFVKSGVRPGKRSTLADFRRTVLSGPTHAMPGVGDSEMHEGARVC
jgi:DNA-binding MarR family transcriptional regulator